jgi:histidinol dehydrogenase
VAQPIKTLQTISVYKFCMEILHTTSPDFDAAFKSLLNRQAGAAPHIRETVAAIIQRVRTEGDAALLELTARFDRFTPPTLRLSSETITEGAARCPQPVREALELAAQRITAFHSLQKPADLHHVDALGVRMGMLWRPVDAVGLYVPGGRASYPSSVLMNAIPARVAGVPRIALTVPMPDGISNPAVLAAAQLAGVAEIYCIGGAQAVAALACGTASIPVVDKIVGPGNAWVAEAKRQVFGQVGIDAIAGPSEILVLADDTANPDWVAWDLLSQAEHDPMAQAILITDSAILAVGIAAAVERVLTEVSYQSQKISDVARHSWRNHGAIIVVRDLAGEGVDLANRIAAEHLEVQVANPAPYLTAIRHAGSVFLGQYTPEAIGDYLGGPNHVLPTNGTARFASGLSVYDFLKRTTYLECNEAAFRAIGPAAAVLADAEGLPAHAGSVRVRANHNPSSL